MAKERSPISTPVSLLAILLLVGLAGDARSGPPATSEDLKVGQTVSIEGRFSSEMELIANEIEIFGRSNVRGIVASLDVGAGKLVIQGIPITTTETTRIVNLSRRPIELGELSNGATVKARGWLQQDGTLKADEIEMRRPSSWGRVQLEGTLQSVDAKRNVLRVLGNDVMVTRASRIRVGGWARAWFEDLEAGQPIELEGAALDDGSVLATYILVRRPDDATLEGPIDSIDSGSETLTVLGTRVLTIPGTRYVSVGGASVDFSILREASTVEVKGRLQRGMLIAEEIEVRHSEATDEVKLEGKLEAVGEASLTLMGVTLLRNRNTDIEYD